jgi:hypothetical protein
VRHRLHGVQISLGRRRCTHPRRGATATCDGGEGASDSSSRRGVVLRVVGRVPWCSRAATSSWLSPCPTRSTAVSAAWRRQAGSRIGVQGVPPVSAPLLLSRPAATTAAAEQHNTEERNRPATHGFGVAGCCSGGRCPTASPLGSLPSTPLSQVHKIGENFPGGGGQREDRLGMAFIWANTRVWARGQTTGGAAG